MANAPLVEVVGARAIRASLRRAGHDMETMKAANAAAAEIVMADARARVPVDSGTLKETIRSSGTTTAGIVRAGFARVPYAGPIHWGWPARGIHATYFMSNAAEATEPQWIAAYEAGIEKALDQIKGQ